MKRTSVWLTLSLCLSCATGSPVGGRAGMEALGVKPFAAPAAPRWVPPLTPEATQRPLASGDDRQKAIQVAKSLVGKKEVILAGRKYPDDCTGLMTGIFDQIGVDLLRNGKPGENGVTTIYRNVSRLGRVYKKEKPTPGDLVFFSETYDVNRDGRHNDGLTHVGLVESVDERGTVLVIHRTAKGVVRYHMNLDYGRTHQDKSGEKLNDYLRATGTNGGPALTAQLFASFGSVWRPPVQLAQQGP